MKNSIKSAFCKFGFMLFLVMLGITGKSQVVPGGQYSISIATATATANTIDVPLVVTVLNPSGGMRLTGFQTSINFNSAIINGGTITGSFIPSSSVQFNTIGTVNSGAVGNVRMSLTSISNGASGVDIAQGASLTIGTIRISNTANWSTGNANLWLQNVLASGKTQSLVQGVAYATSGAAYSYTTAQPASPVGLTIGYTSTSTYSLSVGQICATAASQSASSAVTCFGGTNGTSTITMSPTPTVAAISYTVDGGSSQSATLSSGAFTVSGLTAGAHTIVISNTGCSNVTASSSLRVRSKISNLFM